jgi:hypothetical protein
MYELKKKKKKKTYPRTHEQCQVFCLPFLYAIIYCTLYRFIAVLFVYCLLHLTAKPTHVTIYI